jgi:serine/threonine-protein kinase
MDLKEAEDAIKKAWSAGLISGIITLIVTGVAMAGYDFMGITAWNLVDVVFIFGLTFGIYRKSRTCAVIMLVYFVGSKFYMWIDQRTVAGLPLALVFGYFFIQGVRGAFAYHGMASAGAAQAVQSAPGTTPKFSSREEYEQWKAQRLAGGPAPAVPSGSDFRQPEKEKSSGAGWAVALLIIGVLVAGLFFTDFGKNVLAKFSTASAPQAWEEYSSQEGNFSALMPGTPQYKKQPIQTAAGAIDMHMFSREFGNSSAYIIMYADYPQSVTSVPADKLLDGARDGAVGNSKGKLVQESGLILDGGHPGRELTVDMDGKGRMKLRLFMVRQRLYQVMVLGSNPEFIESEANTKYLTSFKLISP